MARVFFMEDYVLWTFRGRGLPKPMDLEVMARAEKRAREAAERGRPAASVRASTAEAPGVVQNAVLEQLKLMNSRFDGIESQLSKIPEIESRLQGLASKVGNLSPNPGNRDKNITCNKCGQKGHREANCTN